jgi:hypothetical protein
MSWKTWLAEMRTGMDINTEFKLFSHIGAGPLKFGMSPTQAKDLLGAADMVSASHLNQRVEHRAFMTLGYSNSGDGKLDHIGFGRQMVGVMYGDLVIFRKPYDQHHQHHVLRMLCAKDGAAHIFLGSVILFKLGFNLTGFQDKEEDDLAFAMFPKGEKDYLLHNPKTELFHF